MSDVITGQATVEATKNYADKIWKDNPRISPDSWRILEGLTVGKVGIGTYRMDGSDQQEIALKQALTSGCNLIDTSANYMDEDAELMIGDVLSEMVAEDIIKREEIVIVTKGGYLQGRNLERFANTPPEETVDVSDYLWHCIHPAFLKDQINRSMERMNIDTIDVYLLHNPEYYLDFAHATDMNMQKATEEYYRRIQEAFVFLEKQVMEGKIGCYGISSNTLVSDKDAKNHTDLARVAECANFAAQEAWGRRKRSSFRVIQLPLNILEPSAIRNINTNAKIVDGEEEVSTLELATRMKLSILANRPLNAFPEGGGVFRLAEGEINQSMVLDETLAQLAELEHEISDILGGWPAFNEESVPNLSLDGPEVIRQIENSIHFDHMDMNFFRPQAALMDHVLESLIRQQPDKEKTLSSIRERYKTLATRLATAVKHYAHRKDIENCKPIDMEIRGRMPEKWRDAPIQQLAINTIASTPGVTCVLCGLRSPEYLKDIKAIYEKGDFPDVAGIIEGHI
jgi:aryl-alcohol dehydrogenase-like predicted oxidoreductase